MRRHNILIVYGTTYGHTTTIAARMQRVLASEGMNVTLSDVNALPADFDPERFTAIMVGASVIGGKHQRAVERFVWRYLETLNRIPTAFFSVSGSASSADPRQQSDARELMERFLSRIGWNPDLETTLGGAILFTKYSWFTRWIMKRIMRQKGGPTDTTRDHVFTDWEHVEEFARRFAHVVDPAVLLIPS
jgi:menaquinone-dependent protoporphyrinogen oxidase